MKQSILILGVDSSVQDSLQKLLGDFGYDVLSASSGEDAEVQLREGRFDLLILDTNLPKHEAWAVMEFLFLMNPLLPVLILAGLGNTIEARLLPALSAVMQTPVEVPEMLHQIEQLLNESVRHHLFPTVVFDQMKSSRLGGEPKYVYTPYARSPRVEA